MILEFTLVLTVGAYLQISLVFVLVITQTNTHSDKLLSRVKKRCGVLVVHAVNEQNTT